MKLVASMIVRNELSRYLDLTVAALLEFCDEVRAVDDHSTDGTFEWLEDHSGVEVRRVVGAGFNAHEGEARQELLEWTLRGDPTHVLAIDADEFVSDGKLVREACSWPGLVATLLMEEVWTPTSECLCIREDGGWRPHPVPILWRNEYTASPEWRIPQRKLASGREPAAVTTMGRRGLAQLTGTSVLHFGWANPAERQARYDRYMQLDAGKFHARQHLDSIVWPEERMTLEGRPWPAGLPRAELLARTRPS